MRVNSVHFQTEKDVKKELEIKIVVRASGFIFEDERGELNLFLRYDLYDRMKDFDEKTFKYFQEMFKCYKIKKIWAENMESREGMTTYLEKLVWDDQTWKYCGKEGLTNTNAMRLRLIGFELDETGRKNKEE